jgi:hypothetical protein
MEFDLGYISVPYSVFDKMRKEFFEKLFKDKLNCTSNEMCFILDDCEKVRKAIED